MRSQEVAVAQHSVEVILTRQLASYLAMPIVIVDPDGTMVFYNEPAETILGSRFEDTGELSFETWTTTFHAADDGGEPIKPDEFPLTIAFRERRASHKTFHIRALDGRLRTIAVTAFPLTSHGDFGYGAAAIFWESEGA